MTVKDLILLLRVVDPGLKVDIHGGVLRCLSLEGKPVMEVSVEDGRYRCASLLEMYVVLAQSATDQTDNVGRLL